MGDEDREYTYVGKQGATVIDYVLTNNEGWNRIKSYTVKERTESDQLPLKVVWERNKEGKRQREEKKTEKEITIWDIESIREFRSKCEKCKEQAEEVQEAWRELQGYTKQCN